MAGIAGIAAPGKQNTVKNMLNSLSHRGHDSQVITTSENLTIGMTFTIGQKRAGLSLFNKGIASDNAGGEHFARVTWNDGGLHFERGMLGVKPLYVGKTDNGGIVFASEVKSLLPMTESIKSVKPGIINDGYSNSKNR